MKATKRTRFEAHGWRVGSAAEFLELSPEEAAFVERTLRPPFRRRRPSRRSRFPTQKRES